MNNIQLLGRLVKDADLTKGSKTKKGYARFTLAVPRGKDETDFINCIAFEKTGELVSEYVKKGQRLLVEGSLNVRTAEDKDGNKTTYTNVIVSRIHFIESAKKEDDSVPEDLPY